MRIPRRKVASMFAVVCVTALMTLTVGKAVEAAVAWQHLWNYPTFKIDYSLASIMSDHAVSAGNNFSDSTDLSITGNLGALHENFWRGIQGWSRIVGIDGTSIQWGNAPGWNGPVALSGMPGSGDMQAVTNYRMGDFLLQSIWRSNQGYIRYVPIVADAVQWGNPQAWQGPVGIGTMPGSGDMQAHGDYAVGNTLMQAIWRNNQGWSRSVPIVNNEVQWSQAGTWSGPLSITTLPGSGDMQAQDNFVVGNTYWQTIWRSNTQWTRSAPIVNGAVQFGQASNWSNTTSQEDLPGSGNVQAQGNFILGWTDTGTQQVPAHGAIRPEWYNWGPTGYIGYAYPLNRDGFNCYIYVLPQVATGLCNTTTQKAASARILLNSYQDPADPTKYRIANAEWLLRHELGHVFGIWHSSCPPTNTVMCPYASDYGAESNIPSVLQQDEINWINTMY